MEQILKESSVVNMNYSHGDANGHECGYCKKKDPGSKTMGFTSDSMLLKDYKDLMDRGWRKCQDYYYKPNNITSCCICSTIRMDTTKYKIRNSHKKIWNRWRKF